MGEGYQIVSEAPSFPSMCAVSCDREGPFVDLNTMLAESGGCHGYLHVSVVEQIGRAVGMVPQSQVDPLLDRVKAMVGEIADLADKLEALEKIKELETNLVA